MTISCTGYEAGRPCPVECQSQQLLDEFRAWRDKLDERLIKVTDEIADWKQDQGERIVALETIVKPALQNNGQPCRLAVVETRITDIEKIWWKAIGASSAVWAILTVVLHFLPLAWRH